jgi:hypothetical protein
MAADLTYAYGNKSFNMNIKCYYRAPKKSLDFKESFPNYNKMSVRQIREGIPKNYNDNNEDFWYEEQVIFYGKDGTSNAYVKRGLDDEEVEYFDRALTQGQSWRIETNNQSIDFEVGGKIIAAGREWIIVRIVRQQTTQTIQNQLWWGETQKDIGKLGTKLFILV